MYDLAVPTPDGAHSLAAIGGVLGAAGVGLEALFCSCAWTTTCPARWGG
jgi:hypothetical protein